MRDGVSVRVQETCLRVVEEFAISFALV
jgi:hypothetical protein